MTAISSFPSAPHGSARRVSESHLAESRWGFGSVRPETGSIPSGLISAWAKIAGYCVPHWQKLHRNETSYGTPLFLQLPGALHIHFQHPADSAVNQIVIIQETAALFRLIHNLIRMSFNGFALRRPRRANKTAPNIMHSRWTHRRYSYEVTGVQQLAPFDQG